jgi:Family of unknown function (DUF6516)
MARGAIGNKGRCPVMRKFVEQFEKTVNSSPIVLSSSIQKQFGPSGTTVYLKGSLRFIDATVLELALYANESGQGTVIDKYRFQYMSEGEQLIFRYDNAPHHPELASFPHHKHTPDKVILSSMPSIKDLLNEISAAILRNRS